MTVDLRKLVLVVDPDQGFVDGVRDLLSDQRVLTARDVDEAAEIVLGGRVDLILVGPSLSSEADISAAGRLREHDPSCELVLVAEIVSNRILRAALRNGFSDVVDAPLDHHSVSELVGTATAVEVTVVVETAASAPVTERVEPVPPPEVTAPVRPPEAVAPAAPPEPQISVTFTAEEAQARLADQAVPEAPEDSPEPPSPAQVIESEKPAPLPPPFPPPGPSETVGSEHEALVPPFGEVAAPPVPVPPEVTGARQSDLVTEPLPPQEPPPGLPPVADSVPPPYPPETPIEQVASPDRPSLAAGAGRVVAVMAGKGGSGKTVLATNLAIAMGLRGDPERVALVDADLQFGDVALLLQLDPVRTIDDVIAGLDDMTDAKLEAALLRHESGLRVMAAPLLPVKAGEIPAKSVVAVVDRLRNLFDTVVVDTAPVYDEGLVTLLEHSDDVVVVVDMDLPSVKNAKVALDGLRSGGFEMEKVTLVVNRANSKARLDLVELERSLGLRVGGSVPSDRLVPQSVNEGIPVIALSPRSKVARAFYALAERLDPEAARERLSGR